MLLICEKLVTNGKSNNASAFFGGTHGKRNFHIINRESKDAFQLFSLDIFLEQNLVVWSKVFLHEWQEERVENREIKFHVPRKNLKQVVVEASK